MRPNRAGLPRLRERLLAAVAAACRSLPAPDREDIVQTVLARMLALDAAGEWNQARPASYLWKMAFHATIDELRRRRNTAGTALAAGEEGEPVAPQPDPEAAAGDRELGGAIRACLAGLLGERRAAVALSLQGHAAREVASLLGFTLKKAENLIFRGTADLRRCLGGKGYGR